MAVSASLIRAMWLLVLFGGPTLAARKHHGTQAVSRRHCREGWFDDRQHGAKNGTMNCRPCSQCLPGYGVSRLCTLYNDTECSPCPTGQHSDTTSQWDDCIACRQCKKLQRACTASSDTVCSSYCTHGNFYSRLFESCFPCSMCQGNPQYDYGEDSLWVEECQQPGIEPNMQCWPLPTDMTDNEVSNTVIAVSQGVHPAVQATVSPSPRPWKCGNGDDPSPAPDLDESTARIFSVVVYVLISVSGLCAVVSVVIIFTFCLFMRKLTGKTTSTKNGYQRISEKTSKLLVKGSTYV